MKVILTEDIKNLGTTGTIQEVKNGYARNYLLPRGLAKPATPGTVKLIEQKKAADEKKLLRAEEDNRALATQIEQQTIRLTARVGQNGRLYGSITSAQIAEALSSLVGQEIDRRKVDLPENIHSTGQYEVPVRLVGRLAPKVKVVVEAEGETEAAAPAATEAQPEVVESGSDTVQG
ncbi:MAG: ribosomal protein [Chloroflexi bacterium]|jgi:large subunit ribosomal protein L9|nr:ribosomal protein [Chloroflexota bacterium]